MTGKPNMDYAVMPISDLYACLQASENELARAKADHAVLLSALGERFSAAVSTALRAAGKTHGTVNVPLGDGFMAKADFGRKVEWDQDKLRALAGSMPWEQASHYFTIKLGVSETIYKAIPPGDLRDNMDDARTTTPQAPKIMLLPPKGAE